MALGTLALLAGGGALIGFLLSVLGAGGSILLLPLLVSGASLPTKEAVPLSLLVVMLLALGNLGPYLRRGQIAPRPALLLGLPALAGSWIGGSWVKAGHGSESLQLLVFACAALAASWLLTRPQRQTPASALDQRSAAFAPANVPLGVSLLLGARRFLLSLPVQGLLVGVLTGVAGVGGGFAIVPALVLLAGLPMALASGTSLLLIAVNALVALAAQGHWPAAGLPLLLPLLLGGAIGAALGQRLAPRISDRRLRQGLPPCCSARPCSPGRKHGTVRAWTSDRCSHPLRLAPIEPMPAPSPDDASLANETDTIMQLFDLDTRSATTTDTDPFMRRQKYIMLVLKMFSLAAKAAPLVVVIEDLHWLDSQSLDVIDHLFLLTTTHPILLVCTSRPEGVKDHWKTHDNLIMQFGSLDDVSSRQLIASLSLDNDLSEGSIATIQRKTQGNPLFIEEIIRSLRPGNLLASDSDQTLSDDSKMPSTIQMAIAERIDRLPQKIKHYLQVLSVIGVKSKPSLFVKFISEKADELKVVLADLERLGFIACSTLDNEEYVQFVHIITQEVVSSTLLGETRAFLHEKIADTMHAEYGELFHEILPDLAHHYHNSANTQKAVQYLRLAGESAIQQSAHQEAQNYLRHALSRLECDSSISDHLIHLSHIWLSLGVSLQVTLGYTAEEVKKAYEQSIHFSEKAGHFECLFAALRGCAVFAGVRADYHDVEQIATRLKKLAKGNPEFAHEHLVMHGLSFSYRGNLAKGARCYQKGIALRVAPAKSTLIQYSGYSRSSCYSYLALNVLFAGRLRLAKANAIKGLEVAIESGIPIAIAQCRGMYANVHFSHCEFELALQQHELNIAFADEHGFSYWSLLGRLLTTWGRGFLGSDVTAVAEYASYLSAYRNSGALIGVPWFLNMYAELLWSFERHSDALDAIVQAEETASATDERFFLADSLRLKGEMLAFIAGNACSDDSLQCIFQSLQLAHSQGAWLPAMRTAIWLTRLLMQASCCDQAALMLGYHYNKVSWVKGPIHDEARSLMADLGIDRSFLSALKKDPSRMPVLDVSRLRTLLSPPVDGWHILAKTPLSRN